MSVPGWPGRRAGLATGRLGREAAALDGMVGWCVMMSGTTGRSIRNNVSDLRSIIATTPPP